MAKRKTTRKPKGVVLNLDVVNPRGRVDVLVARMAERVIQQRYPAFAPLFEKVKPTIHQELNSMLGPDALPFDLTAVMERLVIS